MSNPISEIQQQEKKSQEKIERKRASINQDLIEFNKKYQNRIDNIKEELVDELDVIVKQAKEKIQEIGLEKKNNLEKNLGEINSTDQGLINKAADVVVKKIIQ